MKLVRITFVLGALSSCGGASTPAPEPVAVAPIGPAEAEELDVPGCDEERLVAFLSGLGGRDVSVEPFVGELAMGEPLSRSEARCEVRSTESECLTSVATEPSTGQSVSLIGTIGPGLETPLEVDGERVTIRVERAGEVDARVEAFRAEGHEVSRGESRRIERVVWEPEVCVSTRAKRRARLPRAHATGIDGFAALLALRENPDLDVEVEGARFAVRCRAPSEAEPPLLADGPCAELRPERRIARARRQTSCDAPDLGGIRYLPNEDGSGLRLYGLRLTNILSARLGLQNGATISRVCGAPFTDPSQLQRALETRTPGCTVEATLRGEALLIDLAAACAASSDPG